MSFLKITDPKKRDFIVNEFLKTRQNIQQNFLSERVGDLSTQYERSHVLTLFPQMLKSFLFKRLLNQKLSYQWHTERDNVICYQFLNPQVLHGD